MLRMHRRDRCVEGGRPRKKEESLFALLRLVSVHGVTVVAAIRGCVTEPLLLENSTASLGSTSGIAKSNKYPNFKSIKELIYKKGHMKIEKQKVPLTDNNIIEQELGKYLLFINE
ncbi:uncharacterized protein LOC130980840 [Arachis stenosperma]|uniref:uncharacterized protein LOC130980840 n=1 Tax=Arachis stenosperma TaxID=217475 RepID=UPI0025ACAB77|nr:uncharacterized protein LOC130980840 [Arachis stenosperma]